VRAHSVVWNPDQPWTTAAAGAAYTVAVALGATLPGVLFLLVQSWAAALRARRQRGGAAAAGSGESGVLQPLLATGSSGAVGGGCSVSTARIVGGGGSGSGNSSSSSSSTAPLLETGVEGVAALPLHSGRPNLRRLVAGWLAAVRQLPGGGLQNGSGGEKGAGGGDEGGDAGPLQVGCFGMGPSGLLSQVQLLCNEVNRGGGWGDSKGGEKPGVFMRYVQKTHNL